jgi:hypothetical protein
MARAKPKKWAAESLVSETESKAIASPEQQKMAGELTAEMLLMMSPVPGGKKAVKLAKKLFKGKGKGKAGKVSDKKLLELYQKAHPGAKVSKNMISKKPAKISENMLSKKPAKTSENMLSKSPAKTSEKRRHRTRRGSGSGSGSGTGSGSGLGTGSGTKGTRARVVSDSGSGPIPAKIKTSDDVLRAYNKAHPGAKVSKKAKGGSVKKYSSGGGVRKARF